MENEPLSTLDRIFETQHRLEDARTALQQIEHDPRATTVMMDAAYQTVATLVDRLGDLNNQWDAEVAAWQAEVAREEVPASISVAGQTFVAIAIPFDVPGDVTHRDTRPVAGESAQDRVIRLAVRAVIDGVRLYRNPAAPIVYATSAARSTLYGIDPAALRCSCAAQGMCKHLALYGLATGTADRLTTETLAATLDDAMRVCREGAPLVERCLGCTVNRATIALFGDPVSICPGCAYDLTQLPRFAAWPIADQQALIRQLNRQCGYPATRNVA